MNKEDYELVKEALSKVISKKLEDDINKGKELLFICKKSIHPCPIKDTAITYMNNMEKKYGVFNGVYNLVNGYNGSNNITVSKCNWLKTQVWIIEKIKKVKDTKDCKDNSEKVNKLLELLKEGK